MTGARLRHLLRTCLQAWVRAWAWLGLLPGRVARVAFALVCWLIAAMLLGGLFLQLLAGGGKTDPKILAALLAGILPAAFLGTYGREVASRIKKLGPFELFEIGRATGYLEDLSSLEFDDLPDEVSLALAQQHGIRLGRFRLSDRQGFSFERGDRYLNYLEYSGSEQVQGRQQSEHWKQLLTIGRSAFLIGQWTKAIHWLERLEELSHRTFQPARVDYYAGMAHVFSLVERPPGAEVRQPVDFRKHARRAEERLGRLAREHSLDYLGYFWLAYVQDELGYWYEAVQSNEAALERRPRYAPSKYNAAVSRAKLGQYQHAWRMLESIAPADEYAKDVLTAAEKDTELWDAVKDPTWLRRMRYVVRRSLDLARNQP